MALLHDEHFIQNAIRHAIEKRVAEVLDVEIKAAQERVRQQIGQEVDRIALSVLSNYSVERMGQDIMIRVIKSGVSG